MAVFVSYRRADLGGHASMFVGRMVDRLIGHFGEAQVCFDIHSIPPGRNFAEFLDEKVAEADAMLVVIGPDWLRELHARKDDHRDFVAYEITSAIRRGLPIIPVLMDGASMPEANSLRPGLALLAGQQAVTVDSAAGFDSDMHRLLSAIEAVGQSEFIDGERFQAVVDVKLGGNALRYRVQADGRVLTYAEVVDFWVRDAEFGLWYSNLLKRARYPAYVWETPPVAKGSVGLPFEFVLMPSPERLGEPNRTQYQKYFDPDGADHGVVNFLNLGKDSELIVPSPLNSEANYADLTHFLRNAPKPQQAALWRSVGRRILHRLGDKPIWVSVAGGGILWLHVRIDYKPKYYQYSLYRSAPAARANDNVRTSS